MTYRRQHVCCVNNMGAEDKKVEYLVVDTTAFIQNAPLQEIAQKVVTCQEVVDEILNKRQLRRLIVLPYDLQVKEVFPESIKIITDFSKKTGDYPSLSATDIKVMALTYQLEKEHVGVEHLRSEPIIQKTLNVVTKEAVPDMQPDVTGFFMPGCKSKKTGERSESESSLEANVSCDNHEAREEIDKLKEKFGLLDCNEQNDSQSNIPGQNKTEENDILDEDNENNILTPIDNTSTDSENEEDEDDDSGWITPNNVSLAKKQVNSELIEEKHVTVACMTTDFAMQNVLKQMNLNVAALDGRMIKQLRTFILRCYACFKTTSIMTKKFCPKCGHDTLKKVAVSLDQEGKMQIHINARRPLTGRGKKFSLPRMKGGKHPNNPVLVEDHPMPQNMASKLARTKVNPLDDDYIAGYSPFAVRDVTSRSAQLGIRPGQEMKYWMRKNPNEARRKRK